MKWMAFRRHVTELLSEYVLGHLSNAQKLRVAHHVAACGDCRNRLIEYQHILERLAASVPGIDPPASLKQRVMDRLETNSRVNDTVRKQLAELTRSHVPIPLWALALTLLLIVGGIVMMWNRYSLRDGFYRSANLTVVPLSSAERNSRATGLLIIGTATDHCTLIVDGLPHTEETYRLSIIYNGDVLEAGDFRVSSQGYHAITLPFSPLLAEKLMVRVSTTGFGNEVDTEREILYGRLDLTRQARKPKQQP